jgi:hypothetical protein
VRKIAPEGGHVISDLINFTPHNSVPWKKVKKGMAIFCDSKPCHPFLGITRQLPLYTTYSLLEQKEYVLKQCYK